MGGSGCILERKEHSTEPWTQGLTEGPGGVDGGYVQCCPLFKGDDFTEMLWGGRWEGGSCLGTHVRIKDFKIKKKKKKRKKKKNIGVGCHAHLQLKSIGRF